MRVGSYGVCMLTGRGDESEEVGEEEEEGMDGRHGVTGLGQERKNFLFYGAVGTVRMLSRDCDVVSIVMRTLREVFVSRLCSVSDEIKGGAVSDFVVLSGSIEGLSGWGLLPHAYYPRFCRGTS